MTLNNTNFDQLLDDAKEYLHYFIECMHDQQESLRVFKETKVLIIKTHTLTEGAERHYNYMYPDSRLRRNLLDYTLHINRNSTTLTWPSNAKP